MRLICTLLSILIPQLCWPQQAEYSAFTVKDGLPSNHVYQCIEDDDGFLWVATDGGVARFDGRHFQVFTTQHGLPDNEVLQVVKDIDGTLWVNCLRQSPAYFDVAQNRFINAKEDLNLARVSGTSNMQLFALENGGVLYFNEFGSFIFRNKRLVRDAGSRPYLIIKFNGGDSMLGFGSWNNPSTSASHWLYMFKGDGLDSLKLKESFRSMPYPSIGGNRLQIFLKESGKCYVYSGFENGLRAGRIDSIKIPEPFFNYAFAPGIFYMISNSATIYVFDQKTLQPYLTIKGDFLPNGFYIDRRGNRWICTVDKGLLVQRKDRFAKAKLPPGFVHTNFLSVARSKGALLAGNYYGSVVEIKNGRFREHIVIRKIPSRIRKVLVANSKVFTISEDGIHINYTTPVINTINYHVAAGKTGIVYDDSTVLVGSFGGFMRIDSRTGRFLELIRYKRVMCMARTADGNVYFGSTDGLYRYYYASREFESLAALHPSFSERVSSVVVTPDSLIWVATSGNGIVVMKNGKPLANITTRDGLINNACRSLAAGRDGQVWMGSAVGISVIHYRMSGTQFSYSVQNLTVNDGLAGNAVNEMLYDRDTIFAATGGGISMIPASVDIPSFDIPVRLIRIRINQKDSVISDEYRLDYGHQYLEMQFAAIELDGHFRNLQYSLDPEKGWTNLTDNILALQLSSGSHNVHVRAVDVNGHISQRILVIRFDVTIPFWKRTWFWVLTALMVQVPILILVARWQRKKKENRLAREVAKVQTASLEQQAFTSLLNPHFMFNALNSIQHYINQQDRRNANRYLSDFASLIRKNFEAAQRSFISLEQELENLRIYLRLEQMRFGDRFVYEICGDEKIDGENWMIPTMMLQPLLENAILHGIMPLNSQGRIRVDLEAETEYLRITITDNGIGVENSLARKHSQTHKSHGMVLIRKRIQALNHFTNQAITMEMHPASADPQNPGNATVLCIPADLYATWYAAGKN